MKGIIFSGDPIFGDTVKVLMLSPPGVQFDAKSLGDHFYGVNNWHFNEPPMRQRTPRRLPAELLATPLFRFSSAGLEWEEFLDDVYDSVDFVLFFANQTRKLHEVSQMTLADYNPSNYAFTFFDISRNKPMTARRRTMTEDKVALAAQMLKNLQADGWSVAAIARGSGVNQITLNNIKHRKVTRLTDKVYEKIDEFREKATAGDVQQPVRGRSGPASGTSRPTGSSTATKRSAPASPPSMSLINTNYVSVDITQLQSVIDRLIENFSDAITELQSIRGLLKR